ncbi:hypothetical protein ACFY19_31975 [Streptosporangium saharense]|uniref:hypothetical protein n=1 Tax=Streptosporangium saharense TaxID=1706840 RepID=UPI0036A64BF0
MKNATFLLSTCFATRRTAGQVFWRAVRPRRSSDVPYGCADLLVAVRPGAAWGAQIALS